MSDAFDDDALVFEAEEDTVDGAARRGGNGGWKVVIVDDDPGIHDVTKLSLSGFEFAGRKLHFISCYSGAEAKRTLADNPDTALVLLDVVMETDHAGLEVARYIREDLKNWMCRIVLRTGQPGQAPERQVITEYDINDYKEKTDLTATKLFSLLFSSLRSYRDIVTIEQNKRGLERVISASANVFELTSMSKFAKGTLQQLTALLHLDPGAVYMHRDGYPGSGGLAASVRQDNLEILAATGAFCGFAGGDARAVLPPDVIAKLDEAARRKSNYLVDDSFIGYFQDRRGTTNLAYMSGVGPLSEIDRRLLEMFTQNVSIAFENVQLHEDVAATQREIVYLLGEAVETRSQETGHHVKRVAEISRILAKASGMDDEDVELIKHASPLHDIGKVGIPDAILNKPGKLDPAEWEIMKSHAVLGHRMLAGSERKIIKAGAIIALEHHEKWDGTGYPHGKSGEGIHIYGRIAALADVFDALGSERAYKKAWPTEKAVALVREERGRHFDPALVDVFLDNLDVIVDVRSRFADG